MSQNETQTSLSLRTEEDLIGPKTMPEEALYGVHTVRAVENFPLSHLPVYPALIAAFGEVKLASAQTNKALGMWDNDPEKAKAIEAACREMAEGKLDDAITVDALQGGAGTSTNMNVNEVLANRALQLVGDKPGNYTRISPFDINLHQSTNDAYPTALKLAVIRQMKVVQESLAALALAFRRKEKEFANILKIGRTQLQDAVPTTLGREMGAYAAAFERDRKRIAGVEANLCVVNLGGTAIGTGISAPHDYIERAAGQLREITGIPFVRADDMIDNTQNADTFAEVSGALKAYAVNLIKCATDLRLLSSGPDAGLGEVFLPPRQAGSSIMPGKVNPVIPEAATQAAMRMIGYDLQVTMATSAGNLELNAFLPLVSDCLLRGGDLMANAADMLRQHCVDGLKADEEKCRARVEGSTALVTGLVEKIGYVKASAIAKKAKAANQTIRQTVLSEGVMSESEFEALVSPEAALGTHAPKSGQAA